MRAMTPPGQTTLPVMTLNMVPNAPIQTALPMLSNGPIQPVLSMAPTQTFQPISPVASANPQVAAVRRGATEVSTPLPELCYERDIGAISRC